LHVVVTERHWSARVPGPTSGEDALAAICRIDIRHTSSVLQGRRHALHEQDATVIRPLPRVASPTLTTSVRLFLFWAS